jgi:hypothetical protein
MSKAASPSFSVLKLGSGWSWASHAMQEIKGEEALISVPFRPKTKRKKTPGRRSH